MWVITETFQNRVQNVYVIKNKDSVDNLIQDILIDLDRPDNKDFKEFMEELTLETEDGWRVTLDEVEIDI